MLSKEIRQYIFQAISSLGEVSSSSIHNAINCINSAIELLKGIKKIALYNNALRTDSIDNITKNSKKNNWNWNK